MAYGKEKRRNRRNSSVMIDWMHILIGIAVVVLAVIVFINPDRNQILLPLVFLLACILNAVTGIYRYRKSGRDKKRKTAAIGQLIFAVILLLITVISFISIWR